MDGTEFSPSHPQWKPQSIAPFAGLLRRFPVLAIFGGALGGKERELHLDASPGAWKVT